MGYKIDFAEKAQEDMDQIFGYVAKHFLAIEAATSVLNNIRSTILNLEHFPEIGVDVSQRLKRKYSETVLLRMLISGEYLIFFIFENEKITIMRVLYQKRNWIEIFR